MDRKFIEAAVLEMVDSFRSSPVLINTGLCADFADALCSVLPQDLGVKIRNTDDLLEEASSFGAGDWLGAAFPPALDVGSIAELDLTAYLSHSWVTVGALHFDAEVPAGAENPFDLPCLRHALYETLALKAPVKLQLLVGRDVWWANTAALAASREILLADNRPSYS